MSHRYIKFILLLALLVFVSSARATTTISGNLQNLGVQNISASGTYVQFSLRNFGSQIPRVSGTSIIVTPDQNFFPDSGGNISGTLYGNNEITPNGTFYQVCVWYQNRQFRCNSYIINPPSFNLNTATPMSTGAPVSATTQVTQSFAFTQAIAATTWTIPHNFGTQQVLVEFFDTAGKLLFPDTVTLTDVNTVTATFVTAQAGSATVLRVSNINIVSPTSGVVLTNPTAGQTILGGFDVSNVAGGSYTASKFISGSANVAATGVNRLSSTDSGPCWRNAANTADLCFSKNASDQLLFNGALFATGTVTNFSAGNFTPLFTTSVATPGTTPALSFVTVNQAANLFYGGPANGAAAAPGFRLLVPADYPVFAASGGSHAAGAVPDPGASAGTTRFLREDVTFQIPPAQFQAPVTATLGSDVTIATSATTILTQALTMPSSGGPFRVLVAYNLNNIVGTSGICDAWVSDGTNKMAGAQIGNSSGAGTATSGQNSFQVSPVTYANAANPTFTLTGICSVSSTAKAAGSQAGSMSTYLNLTVFASN